MTLKELFTSIANAIRTKTGSSGTIKAENFPTAISNIQTGIDTSDATATASDILKDKTAYADGVKLTGTLEVSGEYNAKMIEPETYSNSGVKLLIEEIDMDGILLTSCYNLFNGCSNLKVIKNWNTENATKFNNAINGCDLVTLPEIDTKNGTEFTTFASNSPSLVNVPILNIKSVTNAGKLQNMFSACPNLSNTSLNNILSMCANSYKYISGTKTLKQIGLSSTQATTCQSLSNYQAFIDAGWTTGY